MIQLISLRKRKDGKHLCVKADDREYLYELSPEGCDRAGADIFYRDTEDTEMVFSSSVDHPEDVDWDFDGDVREMIERGRYRAYGEYLRAAKSLRSKIIRALLRDTIFLTSLEKAERVVWGTLRDRWLADETDTGGSGSSKAKKPKPARPSKTKKSK